jgi:hypothetical protein
MLSDKEVSQLDRVQIAASRLLNTVLGGREDEMLSSRIHREQIEWARVIVDRIFFWEKEHCRTSFLWEQRYMAD